MSSAAILPIAADLKPSSRSGPGRHRLLSSVRAEGLEPPRVSPPGPKPGASAGSATLARTFYLDIRLAGATAHPPDRGWR